LSAWIRTAVADISHVKIGQSCANKN
jgi:hypothetical protein